MKYTICLFLICSILVISCTEDRNEDNGNFLSGNGIFLLNEGNFMGGNGSLSFYSYDSLKIYNDVFAGANGRPLGDVPNSMAISGERLYIVVNNSGKIEVVNKNTLESVKTITALKAPRNICIINSSKAYVSSIYSDSLTIIDLTDNKISGYINIKCSSEAISVIRNKAYVSNWVGGNKIFVINTENNKVIDSVEVAMEPESMVIDKNDRLWVLCNGGWKREYFAELVSVNTSTDKVEKRIVFPDKNQSPNTLQINGDGTMLYFLCTGIYRVGIDANSIPSSPYISESGRYFYKLGINPQNEDIIATDAVDFQQSGRLLVYNKNGNPEKEITAGIIPGNVLFSLKDDFTK